MKVLKFGGTSMADASAWRQVLSICSNEPQMVLVVSATSKTTNNLLQSADLAMNGHIDQAIEVAEIIRKRHYDIIDTFLAEAPQSTETLRSECYAWVDEIVDKLKSYLFGIHTLGELTPKSNDMISSFGERISSYLIARCGEAQGMKTVFVDAKDVMKTDSNFGKAAPQIQEINKAASVLRHYVEQGMLPVVGGFYGSNDKGEITTLGRGGSDYSASLFGLAVGATAIEIWTDVSGMYTSDPRFVPGAFSLSEISFNEAAELAYFGAKVLHPATIQPAVERRIPVYVKNTFEPQHPGTKIFAEAPIDRALRAIAFKKDITIVTVTSSRMLLAHGFLARVFNIFEKHQVSVDLVSTSEVTISMSVDSTKNLHLVTEELSQIGSVNVRSHMTLICLVGKHFLQSTGLAGRIFNTLSRVPIQLISQGSSDINLSFVVDNDHALEAVKALHAEFFGV